MKKLIFIAAIFCFIKSSAQQAEFDGKKWNAPYNLHEPAGWDVERFLIPISFAPTIPYKGIEDIRFTPGWAKASGDEYWSYAFLWFLDGAVSFDAQTIEKNLTAYYTGLFNINTDKSKIDTTTLVPVIVSIKSKKATAGDLKTFEGTVIMNDYMTKKPITLNLIAHIKSCEGENKTFAFFELSPKPYNDKVWDGLNQLWATFKCKK